MTCRHWAAPAVRNAQRLALALGACAASLAHAGEDPGFSALHHAKWSDAVLLSSADYPLPEVRVTRTDGRSVWLGDEINDGRAVVLNFIYTTCTTICPLTSQTFSNLQELLGAELSRVHLVSISIDPEEDTPARLASYARRFDAGPEWQFYTASLEGSLKIQRSFHVDRGNKMLHAPTTLVRRAQGQPWIRFDGFVSADELRSALESKAEIR
jgi:protein SCO1/2